MHLTKNDSNELGKVECEICKQLSPAEANSGNQNIINTCAAWVLKRKQSTNGFKKQQSTLQFAGNDRFLWKLESGSKLDDCSLQFILLKTNFQKDSGNRSPEVKLAWRSTVVWIQSNGKSCKHVDRQKKRSIVGEIWKTLLSWKIVLALHAKS